MRIQNWIDLIDKDMPEQGPVTDKTVRRTKREARRFGGNARVSTGRIWTDKEYEERRKRVLNKSLP